ncbi:MAG: hypothetical protein II737_05590 [Mailhella sp.]|nr:hypothetical protein [Mailhella sp.]
MRTIAGICSDIYAGGVDDRRCAPFYCPGSVRDRKQYPGGHEQEELLRHDQLHER